MEDKELSKYLKGWIDKLLNAEEGKEDESRHYERKKFADSLDLKEFSFMVNKIVVPMVTALEAVEEWEGAPNSFIMRGNRYSSLVYDYDEAFTEALAQFVEQYVEENILNDKRPKQREKE